MADSSASSSLAPFQHGAVPSDQVMEEGEERNPDWSDGEESAALPQLQLAPESMSEEPDLSMSGEELDNDDLLDDEEEYQNYLAIQRSEDEKNGHFFLSGPSPTGCQLKVFEDADLHLLIEIEEMKSKFLDRMKGSSLHASVTGSQKHQVNFCPSPPLSLTEQQHHSAGEAVGVLHRVAVLEASLQPKTSDNIPATFSLDKKQNQDNLEASMQSCEENLQKSWKNPSLDNAAARGGKMVVLHSTIAERRHPHHFEASPCAFFEVNGMENAAKRSGDTSKHVNSMKQKGDMVANFQEPL